MFKQCSLKNTGLHAAIEGHEAVTDCMLYLLAFCQYLKYPMAFYTCASVNITYMQPPKFKYLKLQLISTLNMTPVVQVHVAQTGVGDILGNNHRMV